VATKRHLVANEGRRIKGALHAGFPTELWTIKRVRLVIEREFGVTYRSTGYWLPLHRLGFSPRKPEKRALSRDEQAIVTWKRKTWPALRKDSDERGGPSYSSARRVSRRSAR
jgi:transposase